MVGAFAFVPVLLFSDTLALPIAISILTAVGAYELLQCVSFHKMPSVLIPTVLLAAAFPTGIRYMLRYIKDDLFYKIILAAAFIYIFYMLSVAVISKGKRGILDTAVLIVMELYLITGMTSIVAIRDIGENGFYSYMLIFIGAWIPDGAAYFVGRALGKHKLIPDVSPKKTVEGAIGGYLFGGISFVVFALILHFSVGFEPNYLKCVIVGILIAVISMFGDLIASLVKRHYGIKDYGWLFPGHGGVMDRFDSIIAITPFLLLIPPIG